MSERHYILNLLFTFGMTECPLVATPLDWNLKLDVDSGIKECESTQYQQPIRSLIYLIITRPDLSYPVGLLSQFMQTVCNIHRDYAKRVLGYVSGTIDYDISYKGPHLFNSKDTLMPTGLATKLTHDQPHDSSSLSVAKKYPGATKSSRQSHSRAHKLNTGARQLTPMKPFGWKGYLRIWAFPSRIWLPFIATTWAVSIWLGTRCSTHVQSISKCTITSSMSAWSIFSLSLSLSHSLTHNTSLSYSVA